MRTGRPVAVVTVTAEQRRERELNLEPAAQDRAGSGHTVADYFARSAGWQQQVDRGEAFNHSAYGG